MATDPASTIPGIQPCPLCSAGTCIGGPNNGIACVADTSTLGGNAAQSLGQTGVNVVNAIKAANLQGYLINLMVMDYGSTIASNCTIVNNRCDMGKSAIAAAESLHNFHGIPYSQIELTPMIGGNDTQDETFDIGDITAARGMEMYLPLWLRLMGALGTVSFNIKVVR